MISAIKGGGVRRRMANVMKNLHFFNPSLRSYLSSQSQLVQLTALVKSWKSRVDEKQRNPVRRLTKKEQNDQNRSSLECPQKSSFYLYVKFAPGYHYTTVSQPP